MPVVKITILGQSSSLIREKILDSSKFLGYSAGADDGSRDLLVIHNLPPIYGFAHIQVDTERDRDDGREENQETEQVNVPQSLESIECDHGKRERQSEGAEDLKVQCWSLEDRASHFPCSVSIQRKVFFTLERRLTSESKSPIFVFG